MALLEYEMQERKEDGLERWQVGRDEWSAYSVGICIVKEEMAVALMGA